MDRSRKSAFVRHALLASTAAVALSLIGSATTRAADLAWTGGNGDASLANNWSIQTWNGSSWVVDYSTHKMPSGLDTQYIDDPAGTAVLGYPNWFPMGIINVGTLDDGSMLISNSANCTFMALNLGSSTTIGTLTVDGASTVLTSTKPVTIKKGTLNVINGGKVRIETLILDDSMASVNVDGIGSKFMLTGSFPNTSTSICPFVITNGGVVEIQDGNERYTIESVVVDGTGSQWNGNFSRNATYAQISNGATLDYSGSLAVGGTDSLGVQKLRLMITNGSQVNPDELVLGYESGSSSAIINGRGTEINTSHLIVDQNNKGSLLSISSGARVNAGTISILNSANTYIGLDQDSKLVVGDGTGDVSFANQVFLTVGARVAVGKYTPIECNNLTLESQVNQGAINVLGGKWDASTHNVTVAYAKAATAGDTVSIDLANTQRIRFIDSTTGKRLGLAFAGSDTSKILTISASLITNPATSGLTSLLATGDSSYIDAWSIHPTAGYTQGEEAYLSIEVGTGFDITTFKAWHYDGSIWESYTPDDIAYDGLYVGFTVTGFSSYALSAGPSMVSSAVPEPASLGLIGLASFGLLRRKRFNA